MAPKVIPIAGPKDRAALEVTVVDVKTKAVVDSIKVEVYAQRAATPTKKGKVMFTNLALTSGSTEKGDFFDGWVLKLFKPDGNIVRFPPEPQDKLEKPKGGNLHKMTVEVEAPTAAFTVRVKQEDDGKPLAGVEVEVGPIKGKTGADGSVKLDAQLGTFGLKARLKGFVVAKGDGSFAEEHAEQVEVKADGSGSKDLVLKKGLLTGLRVHHPGTRSVRDPSLVIAPPAPASRILRESDSTALNTNKEVVLVRGCGSVVVTPSGNAEGLACDWDAFSISGDSVKPTLTPKDGGKTAELSAALAGAFAVQASWPKGADPKLATKRLMNFVIVAVTVDGPATPVFDGTFADGTTKSDLKGGLIGATSGAFNLTPTGAAFRVAGKARLTGAGDGGLGVSQVSLHVLQNMHDCTVRGAYEDGGSSLEQPKKATTGKRFPGLDANGGVPNGGSSVAPAQPSAWPGTWTAPMVPGPSGQESPFYWIHVTVQPNQTDRTRTVTLWDSPQTGWRVTHPNTKEELESTDGSNVFTSCIAAISADAPNAIVVIAKFTWFVRFKGQANIPVIGDNSWTPAGAQTISNDTAWTPFGDGQEAGAAGIETHPPRVNRGMDLLFTP